MATKRATAATAATPRDSEQKWRRVSIGEAEIRLMSHKPNVDREGEHAPLLPAESLVYVDPPPSIVYHSFDELSDALSAYFRATHQEFSIRNSITVEHANETTSRGLKFPDNDVRFKYASMTYICKHGRTQKRRNNPDLAKSKKVKFAYLGCQACMWVSLVLLGPPGQRRWVYHIHKMVHAHNHELHADSQVASLRPFRIYLDAIYEMKHAGASPQDIMLMLSEREPDKKITIQTVRNILRNYAKDLEAPTPPVRVRAVPRQLQPPLITRPTELFHRLFSVMAKHIVEHQLNPSRVFYLNMSTVGTTLRRSWRRADSLDIQHATDKTFQATVLTTVAADGSYLPPFCVLSRTTQEGRPQLSPNTTHTVNGLVTPDALECWVLHFHSALHPRMLRPVVVLVDHVTLTPALQKLCQRYRLILVSWKDLYAGDKDIVASLRGVVFESYEARLCHQVGAVLPHLSSPQAMSAEISLIASQVFDQTIELLGRGPIQQAFRSSGLLPLSLPTMSASAPPLTAPSKSTYVVEEQRVATITVQTNIMPRYAVDR